MRRMIFSPFGYTLRGGRDNPNRTESIGINLRQHQWAAFVVAGMFAGIAGGIYVFSKGSIFPDEAAIPRSVDALVMVLLGGVQCSDTVRPGCGRRCLQASGGRDFKAGLLARHTGRHHHRDRGDCT